MDLANALKALLSDVVAFKFTAHGFHWNVEGQDFSQYHSLFASIYEDADSSIDPIAENIRKIGSYAPFTLARFASLRSVPDVDPGEPEPQAMATALLAMNKGVISSIKNAHAVAEEAGERGIVNFLEERWDMHMKWDWQLKASTKS